MRPIIQRDPPKRDPAHLKRVRQLPCVACYMPAPSVAHHLIDTGRPRGMGVKVSDHAVISLCQECHTVMHSSSRQGSYFRSQQESWLEDVRAMLNTRRLT